MDSTPSLKIKLKYRITDAMITTDFYRLFAHEFESIPFEETLLPLLKKHIPHMAGANVLDVGAGTGSLALWMKQQGCEVLCIDPSDEMISRCLSKGLCSQYVGLEEFKTDERFDIILTISSLIHIPKERWDKELHHLHTLLKPQGLLFLSVILGDFEGYTDPTNKGTERYFTYIPEDAIRTLAEREFYILETQKIRVEKMKVDFLLLALERK